MSTSTEVRQLGRKVKRKVGFFQGKSNELSLSPLFGFSSYNTLSKAQKAACYTYVGIVVLKWGDDFNPPYIYLQARHLVLTTSCLALPKRTPCLHTYLPYLRAYSEAKQPDIYDIQQAGVLDFSSSGFRPSLHPSLVL